jgi:hypothetical protein
MPIIGNIIKGFIDISGKMMPESSPIKNQQQMLVNLLKKARHTAFGQHYLFDKILESDNVYRAFSSQVPYHDYTLMNKWWKRQLQGEADVTWPGKPSYYALSAGTTENEPKRLPATDDLIEAIRKTSLQMILAMRRFKLPAEFFEKQIMMLGSTTSLSDCGDYMVGEISGISARNIPQWFESYYRPGKDIAAIANWDQRVEAIAREAPSWDVGALAGLPSWNELMLKRVIEYNGASTIHDIWPNLMVFASGGIAFNPYQKSFEALMDMPLLVIDTYLASEGFIAFQANQNPDMAMSLSTNAGLFFEFVPFVDENIDQYGSIRQGAPSFSLDEVEHGVDYVLILSSVAGAWRYMIGDTIRFTDTEKAEIIITGRTKHYLNVVGSQLSVIHMNSGMNHLEEKFGLLIPEYTVAAVRENGEYIHHWYLGTEGNPDTAQMVSELDSYLKTINKSYKNSRHQALKNLRITCVPPEVFYDWSEQEQKKGGQVKMPRVMKEEEFKRWEEFAQKFVTS